MSPRQPASSSETDRTIGDLVREGVVVSVDLDAGKAVVSIGDQVTPALEWSMWTGDVTVWCPPCVGQQVLVTAPEGDIERAFISGGLSSSSMAPLFLGPNTAIRFKDGAILSYDPEAHELRFDLPGSATLVAPDGVQIQGNVQIHGDVTCSGKITAADDVIGGGKSLKTHKHIGVSTGSGVSGAPQ